MPKLNILTYPDQTLFKISSLIPKDDIIKYQELALAMIETMIISNGVGLAAPQIGKNICLIVINKEVYDQKNNLILFNPKINFFSKETSIIEEGCLSLPKIFKEIERPDKIRLKAMNEKGEKIQLKAKGFFSHVVQHEIDHLNGILIINQLRND